MEGIGSGKRKFQQDGNGGFQLSAGRTVIDLTLSDDEIEPHSKRQRSETVLEPDDDGSPGSERVHLVQQLLRSFQSRVDPHRNAARQKLTSSSRTPEPTGNGEKASSSTPKKSPFGRKARWAASAATLAAERSPTPPFKKESNRITSHNPPPKSSQLSEAIVSDDAEPPRGALHPPKPRDAILIDADGRRSLSIRPSQNNSQSDRPRTRNRSPRKLVSEIPRADDRKTGHQSFELVIPSLPATKSLFTPQGQVPEGKSRTKRQLLDEDLLAEFTKPRPDTQRIQLEKETLLTQIRNGTLNISERQASIERHFGPNGFSKVYDVDEAQTELKALAQKQVKKVRRKKIRLDWGSPVVQNQSSIDDLPLISPKDQIHQVLGRSFQDTFDPPLTFVNSINERQLNGKFQFVSEYILRQGVIRTVRNPNFDVGCSCAEVCSAPTCQCLEKEIESEDESGESTSRMARLPTYTTRDGISVLTDEYIDKISSNAEITECNDRCGCDPSRCSNRVVQRGRQLPLEIFQTANCGFGVRSSVPILRGQFIDLYLGEVITLSALEKREAARAEGASSYIYSLDWWQNSSNSHHHIDGENFGGPMRFVNHSCSPNSRTFTVQVENHADKALYYLAFFAVRDIPAGEEVTIDYNPQVGKEMEEEREERELERLQREAEEKAWKGWDTDETDDTTSNNGNSDDNNVQSDDSNSALNPTASISKLALSSAAHSTSTNNPLVAISTYQQKQLLDRRHRQQQEELADFLNDQDVTRCRCGTPNCRVRLWPKAGRKRKRARRVGRVRD